MRFCQSILDILYQRKCCFIIHHYKNIENSQLHAKSLQNITNYSFLKSSHFLRDGGNFNFKKLKSMGRVDIFIHMRAVIMVTTIREAVQFKTDCTLTLFHDFLNQLTRKQSVHFYIIGFKSTQWKWQSQRIRSQFFEHFIILLYFIIILFHYVLACKLEKV